MNALQVWSLLFVVLRALRVVGFLQGGVVACVFGLSEALALATTLRGLARVGRRGRGGRAGLGAWLVPVCYLLPMALQTRTPVGSRGWGWLGLACLGLGLAQIGLRLYLGGALTVGAPAVAGIRTTGPYTLVRHPLGLVETLLVTGLVAYFGGWWNWLLWPLLVAGGVLAVQGEESVLLQDEAYQRYAARVRWRWIPGVW
jgi:protein-S-isoprenylcysteine O-methyltransferase Ste14